MGNVSPHNDKWRLSMQSFFTNCVHNNNLNTGVRQAMLSAGFTEDELLILTTNASRHMDTPADVSALTMISETEQHVPESIVACTHPVIT